MTHLRDVIEIPQRISASDFVVGLSQGVDDRAGTLRTYVVTPQLAECFDKALGLVAGAVQNGTLHRRLPARLVRIRQEPLHGRALHAARARPRRAGGARAGAGRRPARRRAVGEERAPADLPHDRRRQPRAGRARGIPAPGPRAAPRRAAPRRPPQRRPDGQRGADARADGRRGLPGGAQRGHGQRGLERLGHDGHRRRCCGVGSGLLPVGDSGARGRPASRPAGQRPDPHALPGLRVLVHRLPRPRHGARGHLAARRDARLRRRRPVPRRADPLAGRAPGQPRVRHQRGRQARQARRGPGRGPGRAARSASSPGSATSPSSSAATSPARSGSRSATSSAGRAVGSTTSGSRTATCP